MTSYATILIADISGFTDFVSSTAIEHSSHIVNELLELLVESNELDLTVSEIEGDAILFYKKGDAIPSEALVDQCLAMFRNFHHRLKVIERDAICQCGACQGASGLGLKFITHRGEIREITVANFTKASGLDMIIAHRLLKNEVPAREYLLTTTRYVDELGRTLPPILTWTPSTQRYSDVGDIGVHYALLDAIREEIPDPPSRPAPVMPTGDDSCRLEISAPLEKVYMKLVDVEGKRDWVLGLDDLKRRKLTSRIDEQHVCFFQGAEIEFHLLHAELADGRAHYLEEATFDGTPFKHRQLYTLERLDDTTTAMTFEVEWQDDPQPPEELKQTYFGACSASFQIFKDQLEAA